MSVVEKSVPSTQPAATYSSFREMRSAVEGGDRTTVAAVGRQLTSLSVAAIAEHDLQQIVGLRAQAKRLAHSVRSSAVLDPMGFLEFETVFETIDSMLAGGRTVVLGRLSAEQDTRTIGLLRDRIRVQLERGVQRPRDLAAELRVDQAQISRALRRLVADNLVKRTDPPADSSDARAHWYVLVEAA